jgi:hypothetical protein
LALLETWAHLGIAVVGAVHTFAAGAAYVAGLDLVASSCLAAADSSCRSVVAGTSSAAVVADGPEEEFALVVVTPRDGRSSLLVGQAHSDCEKRINF